jgi:hypothetical protein
MSDRRRPSDGRRVIGGQAPREDRGMTPVNQGPAPTTPPPKPGDAGPSGKPPAKS